MAARAAMVLYPPARPVLSGLRDDSWGSGVLWAERDSFIA